MLSIFGGIYFYNVKLFIRNTDHILCPITLHYGVSHFQIQKPTLVWYWTERLFKCLKVDPFLPAIRQATFPRVNILSTKRARHVFGTCCRLSLLDLYKTMSSYCIIRTHDCDSGHVVCVLATVQKHFLTHPSIIPKVIGCVRLCFNMLYMYVLQ